MKPQYQVRNQASELHSGSKALFGTVKIQIHIDPRQSVWGHSLLRFTLLFQKEGFVCVYKVREKTFYLWCPENVLRGVSCILKWHISIGVVEVKEEYQLHAFELELVGGWSMPYWASYLLWILSLSFSYSICHPSTSQFDLFWSKAVSGW